MSSVPRLIPNPVCKFRSDGQLSDWPRRIPLRLIEHEGDGVAERFAEEPIAQMPPDRYRGGASP